jgi:hypothetical protein
MPGRKKACKFVGIKWGFIPTQALPSSRGVILFTTLKKAEQKLKRWHLGEPFLIVFSEGILIDHCIF